MNQQGYDAGGFAAPRLAGHNHTAAPSQVDVSPVLNNQLRRRVLPESLHRGGGDTSVRSYIIQTKNNMITGRIGHDLCNGVLLIPLVQGTGNS